MSTELCQNQFRTFLKSELESRCNANHSYSLRAFAKFLGVEPSALSKILSGKRRITDSMQERISDKLGLSPSEKMRFKNRQGAEAGYTPFSEDQFQGIAESQNLALLELINTRDFKPDLKWIAKRLGLNLTKVKLTIERLERLGLLTIDGENWTISYQNATTLFGNKITPAHKNLQKEILGQAIAAIDCVEPHLRDQTALTVAIDTKRLFELKSLIQKFRRDINTLVTSDDSQNEVYQMSISLFPVTKRENVSKMPRRSK